VLHGIVVHYLGISTTLRRSLFHRVFAFEGDVVSGHEGLLGTTVLLSIRRVIVTECGQHIIVVEDLSVPISEEDSPCVERPRVGIFVENVEIWVPREHKYGGKLRPVVRGPLALGEV